MVSGIEDLKSRLLAQFQRAKLDTLVYDLGDEMGIALTRDLQCQT
jgi:hypothetical protein